MNGKGFISILPTVVSDVGGNFKTSFSSEGFSLFCDTLKYTVILWIVVFIILLIKLSSKKEYANIEYGSADWCPDSEAYKVLSPNQGMILAHKKYLPVIPTPPPAKNGNILIIGGSFYRS